MMNLMKSIKIQEFLVSALTITRNLELQSIQNFHTSSSFYAVNKLLLSNLRKKTGFSISHCKNALEINENDFEKSEEWLLKEAQAHGWAKASNLAGRATAQGLIGVHIAENVGGLVEVNCETDFVARNEDFKGLVNSVTKAFTLSSSHPETSEELIKEYFDKERLVNIQSAEGKSLLEIVALTIGKVGENIQLTRGVKFTAPPGVDLVGYTHPSSGEGIGLAGKFAALVAFKNSNDEDLKRELCTHIVGMNPKEVGTPEEEKSSEESSSESSSESSEEEESEDQPKEEKEETMLVRQKFINDQEVTVGHILNENNIEIVDFIRLECGETQKEA